MGGHPTHLRRLAELLAAGRSGRGEKKGVPGGVKKNKVPSSWCFAWVRFFFVLNCLVFLVQVCLVCFVKCGLFERTW